MNILKVFSIIFRLKRPKLHTDGKRDYWMLRGKLHCEGSPAVRWLPGSHEDGTEEWYRHGQRHREDGPALVRPSGEEFWFFEGRLHRDGGPAVKRKDGTEEWYQHGKRHREDGPAVIWPSGLQEWWRDGHRTK